jgi:hypothetical protein
MEASLDYTYKMYGRVCTALLTLQGTKLTQVINSKHENPKYLPGISLGSNVIADPELESTVSLTFSHCGMSVRYDTACILPVTGSRLQCRKAHMCTAQCSKAWLQVIYVTGQQCHCRPRAGVNGELEGLLTAVQRSTAGYMAVQYSEVHSTV